MRAGARSVTVLRYLSVTDDASPALPRFTTSRRRFAEHVELLAQRGCTALTVTDLVERMRTGALPPGPVVALSFDGGLADVAEHAAPVLARAGLPATVYVPTGFVGGTSDWLGAADRRPLLSWSAVRELRAAGWEIGTHGVAHRELDRLSRLDALYEVVSGRGQLQDELGEDVTAFAYPYGYHSARVRQMVVDVGLHNAAAVKNRPTSTRDDTFALARVTVTAGTDVARLDRLLGRPVPVTHASERLRAGSWRCYRRLRPGLDLR